jgi:hypothetical protein
MPNVQGFVKDPRGYAKIGVTYQTYAPAMDGWDWYFVEFFREYVDSLFVPMSVRTTYRNTNTGSIVHFDRNVIAVGDRHPIKYPHQELQRHTVLHPTDDWNGVRPMEIMDILEAPIPGKKFNPVPGPYIPFQEKHVHEYKAFAKLAEDILLETGGSRTDYKHHLSQRRMVAYRERRQKIMKDFKSESDYRWDHDWAWFTRQFERLTVEERAIIMQNASVAKKFMKNAVGHSL